MKIDFPVDLGVECYIIRRGMAKIGTCKNCNSNKYKSVYSVGMIKLVQWRIIRMEDGDYLKQGITTDAEAVNWYDIYTDYDRIDKEVKRLNANNWAAK